MQKEFSISANNIMKNSIEENFKNIKIDHVIDSEISFAKTENKGVLGSQVDLIYMVTARFENYEYDNFYFINETPMSYLKYKYPHEEFKLCFKSMESVNEKYV